MVVGFHPMPHNTHPALQQWHNSKANPQAGHAAKPKPKPPGHTMNSQPKVQPKTQPKAHAKVQLSQKGKLLIKGKPQSKIPLPSTSKSAPLKMGAMAGACSAVSAGYGCSGVF